MNVCYKNVNNSRARTINEANVKKIIKIKKEPNLPFAIVLAFTYYEIGIQFQLTEITMPLYASLYLALWRQMNVDKNWQVDVTNRWNRVASPPVGMAIVFEKDRFLNRFQLNKSIHKNIANWKSEFSKIGNLFCCSSDLYFHHFKILISKECKSIDKWRLNA